MFHLSQLFKKITATSLIVGLVFPFVSQAAQTNLSVVVTTDTGTETKLTENIVADEDITPIKNLDSLAPNIVNYYGGGMVTIQPEIDLEGPLQEGLWHFGVSRYGESDTGTIQYDTTPPKCPPAPSAEAYENGLDYYTKNNLKNPWPRGLNGHWANNSISFNTNDPNLCRDQIGSPTQTMDVCTAVGGVLVTEGETNFCRFEQNVCPDGWSQYAHWSKTEPSLRCATYPLGATKGFSEGIASELAGCKIWSSHPYTCITGAHNWSDQAPETCQSSSWTGGGEWASTCEIENVCTATAVTAQIGCLPDEVNSLSLADPKKRVYVERKYVSGSCTNPDGNLYYKEDLNDCLKEVAGEPPTQTRPSVQMSGCAFRDEIILDENNEQQIFDLRDKAFNLTGNTAEYPSCLTPVAKIDSLPPEVSLQIEHAGLKLSKENLSDTSTAPNRYRADAGEILLYAQIKDQAPNTSSGISGVNWEALVSTEAMDSLSTEIADAESNLMDKESGLAVLESNIILQRTAILTSLAELQNHIVTHNLLHKVSKEVNNSSGFFIQALLSLSPGLNQLQTKIIDKNLLQDNKDLLNLNKFNEVPQIGDYRDKLTSVKATIPNQKINLYRQDLATLLRMASLSTVGSTLDITPTNNRFNEYYAQWQIDKTKNYTLLFPDWINRLSAYDEIITGLKTTYQEIKEAYDSNNLLVLVQKLDEVVPSTELLGLLLATQITATDHQIEQQAVIDQIDQMNNVLSDTKTYLQSFRPDIDIFDEDKISQIKDTIASVDEGLGNLLGDLKDVNTPNSFAYSLTNINLLENSNEIKNLIEAEGNIIRRLNTEIVELKTSLDSQITTRDSLLTVIQTQENDILNKRAQLTDLIAEQAAITGIDFNRDKVTHIKIERLTVENPAKETFFPPNTTPDENGDYIWDLNSFQFTEEALPIFTQVGTYKVQLIAYDKAKNRTVKTGYIQIYPAKLEVSLSSNCNTAANIPYADGDETCNLELPQRDRFGNLIKPDGSLKLTVRDQNINGSYDLIKELGANYQNGIRFNGGVVAGNKHQLTWDPNNAHQKTIRVKSLLPTLTVLPYEADPDYAIGYNLTEGAVLPLVLEYPNIGPRGVPTTDNLIETANIKVQFKPWVNPRIKGGLGNFDNKTWNPPIAKPFNIYAEANTGSTKPLPPNFKIGVTGFVNPSYEFNNVNVAKPGVDIVFANVDTPSIESTGDAGQPDPLTTTVNSTAILSGQQNKSSLYIPKVQYKTRGYDITLPGIPAGACPDPEKCFKPIEPVSGVDVTISNATATEPGTLSFNVGLSRSAEVPIRIFFKATDNTTTIGQDYSFSSSTFLEIAKGALGGTYNITVNDDNQREDDETFVLSIDSFEPAGVLLDYSDTGLGTILDTDNGIKINDGVVIEGGICLVDVSINRPATSDILVNATLGAVGDSASKGTDYQGADVSGTIPAGETAILIPVQTNEDNIREGDERFTLEITSVTGGDLTEIDAVSKCLIEDNDLEPNAYLLNTTVREGDRAQITVVLGVGDESGLPDNEEVVLRLQTFDLGDSINHATAGLDYEARTFDVTIPANTKSVTVDIINTKADDLVEEDESFGVRIISVQRGNIGSYNQVANVTIQDDTTTPKPSIKSISSEYGVEKTPNDKIQFDVILDYPNESGSDITITLETEDITATGEADYSNGDLTVVIPNGEISGKSTPVTITDDNLLENQESFRVKFKSANPANAFVSTSATGIGYINDNDVAATNIYIVDAIACESNGCNNTADGSISFEVSLDKPHTDTDNNPLIVTYRPTPLTAAANTDYISGEYQARFEVGEQVTTLAPIRLVNNADVEAIEEFEVSFVRVESGHTLGNTTDTAIGQITDDDDTTPPTKPSILISDASGIEGGRAEIKVALDRPAQGNLTVNLAAQNGSAVSADYACPANMHVIFPDGEMSSQSVYCRLERDLENEPRETFEILVSSVVGEIASGGDNQKGEVAILNNQTLDLVIETPEVVMENDTEGLIVFTLNLYDNGSPLNSATSLEALMDITITPEDIVALGGSNFSVPGIDYRSGIINLTLVPGKGEGSTTARIRVEINNDAAKEINPEAATYPENRQENLGLKVESNALNIRNITETEGIIQDDDNTVCGDKANVRVVDVRVEEGNQANFDISLDRTLCNKEVTLKFRTIDGGAITGSDFTGGDFSVTIPRKSKRPNADGRLAIQTLQDALYEGNENFTLEFIEAIPSTAINQVIRRSIRTNGSYQNQGQEPAVATIIDNDLPTPEAPQMTIENAGATEGSPLNFTVNLFKTNPDEETVIRFQASPSGSDEASPDLDFTPSIAVVSITAGEGAGIAQVNTIDDDLVENDESLIMSFLDLDSGFLSSTTDTAIGVIYDNDALVVKPDVTISDASATEGNNMTFTISLDSPGESVVAPEGGIDFNIKTEEVIPSISNTASMDDFAVGESTVTIPKGSSQRNFVIETYQDEIVEDDEIFNVKIISSNKASFVNNLNDTATGTIVDDDTITDDPSCELYGLCPTTPEAQPGAAIEGQIIADEIGCVGDACKSTDDDSIVLGTSTLATDVREEITRNAYELIRGQQPANSNGASLLKNTNGQPIIRYNPFTHSNGQFFPRWDIYVDDLPDGGVTYLSGDIDNDGRITGDENRAYFRIGLRRDGNVVGTLADPALVSGKHTFIIMNASVNVIGDMAYANNDSSLGLIVLNDNIDNLDNLSRRGQLTVYKDVKHIVGTLFTDGSLVSNVWIDAGAGGGRITSGNNENPNDDWDKTNGFDANGNYLGRQLILSGNILSKNTIGKADEATPEGPWGNLDSFPVEERQLRAQMYDFNYMRRYVPTYDETRVHTNANLCAKIPLNGTQQDALAVSLYGSNFTRADLTSADKKTAIDNIICYANTKSFVIRVDPRLRENPPPGFIADSLIGIR